MDGNGRWAQQRNFESRPRPQRGLPRRPSGRSRRPPLGLRALTLYAFSEQNWARPEDEVDALMELLREFLLSERDEILENGIRLNAVGNLDASRPSFAGCSSLCDARAKTTAR